MVVIKENPANKPMINPPLNVGVIAAPDAHYKPVLYSEKEASRMYQQDSSDIFVRGQKYSFTDQHKTPKSLFVIPGIAIAGGLIYKFIKHFKK